MVSVGGRAPSASAHLVDHFDQLGVENAVAAARFTNFPMVKVYAAYIANAGIGRINSNDTKVQNRHQCQCRFDEAENVDLEVAALV